MVSQFIASDEVRLLGEIDFNFPEGIHAIGRLDSHTEGLLILTTNKKVTKLLFQGKVPHQRTYMVMVQKKVLTETVEKLRKGVSFRVGLDKLYTTLPCEVEIVDEPNFNFESPYTPNKYIEYTWLKITLTEGKFHQVRKMVFTVGHRCVRLIRISIENLRLDNLKPGEVRELGEKEFFEKLRIEYVSPQKH
jgi:23S rRNA pseudouridine2457 synthase